MALVALVAEPTNKAAMVETLPFLQSLQLVAVAVLIIRLVIMAVLAVLAAEVVEIVLVRAVQALVGKEVVEERVQLLLIVMPAAVAAVLVQRVLPELVLMGALAALVRQAPLVVHQRPMPAAAEVVV